jgi:hypothetical protein
MPNCLSVFRCLLSLGMALVLHIGWAQTTEVSGRVFDVQSGKPLPYVNIVFGASTTGTITDENGAYSLSIEGRPGRLNIAFLGYVSQSLEVIRGIKQRMDVSMEPRAFDLNAAEVRPDRNAKNPAKPFMQRVLEAKNRNNPATISSASHRVHTRIEVAVNDIGENQINAKYWGPFRFIFDYLDSTQVRNALPILFGEYVADERWQTKPRQKQTSIIASQLSGDFGSGGDRATPELNSRFPEINLYENQILMLDRAFTSPLHDRASAHYRFYILDTLDWKGRATMHLAFLPKRKGEMTFEGEIWLDTLSLAIAHIDAQLSPSANVNFVRSMHWTQSYAPIEGENGTERWMLDAETMLFDVSIADRSFGAYLQRKSTIEQQHWSDLKEKDFMESGRDLQYDSLALQRSEDDWQTLRLAPLIARESAVFEMTDSVLAMPQWRMIKGAGYFFGTGYASSGPLELGAWWSAYTQNPTEGNRFRLDLRTSNAFSTRIMPRVFAAYGTYDQQWKGGFSTQCILRNSPRTEVNVEVKRDLEQFGMAGILDQGEAFTSALRTDSTNLLSEVIRAEASILHEFGAGFSGYLEWRHRQVVTRGNWAFVDPANGLTLERLITSEATGVLRYARGERFVGGEFDRYSLGTEWPELTGTVTWGMPRVLGSQYQYVRCTVEGEDEIRLGWWGRLEWIAQAGKYFGSAPFPLMEVVPTSGTILMSPEVFNLLRIFENVTDEWAKVMLEWHGEGVVLNHLPLLRRLEWREVISARGIRGRWNMRHESLLALPEETQGLNGNYVECGVGIENIFKGFRVDGVWRTDRTLSDPTSWGIRLGVEVNI